LKDEINSSSTEAIFIQADIKEFDDCKMIIETTIKKYGKNTSISRLKT
jgi:hypothetical protein